MAASFTSIPILDLSLARSPETQPQFLDDLRHALFTVGFLYIRNTGIPDSLIQDVIQLGHKFFELPEDEKLRIEMKNSPHFLGYSRLNNEVTAHKIDHREQIDLGSEVPAPLDSEPRYRRLRGPSQWPKEELLPGFRQKYTEYIERMSELSTEFVSLIALALGLPKDAFEKFYTGDHDPSWEAAGLSQEDIELRRKRQDKLKIVKYPDLAELGISDKEGQGVGPHKDSMLSSYLLQASNHRGLQVLNSKGEWIDAPPIEGTLVVALGQGLEAMTSGVCVSTTHRVLSPAAGSGARYSIPFFQGVSYDAAFESMTIPQSVFDLKNEYIRKAREVSGEKEEESGDAREEIEFTFKKQQFDRLGQATLMNRVKSHPDVGEKWYPDLLEEWKKRGVQVGSAY
ncbi:putative isopenicillin N synthetase [Ascobolus immersus RN42]|uniref:Putative isopenicillin N synthetase n=1 Tax=Ascobolus immersus RN42 TaxID=1160509 RepID=A0A3N4I433_ASCIM|nr:putative isopenicillin N synthetase [Ascobolus immersus RN42]